MSRSNYLKRCMMISLKHRVSWVMVGGALGLVLAAILGLGGFALISFTVLGAGLTALGIAIHSRMRHSNDPEAQPPDQSPLLAWLQRTGKSR